MIALAAIALGVCFAQAVSAAPSVSFYGYQVDTPDWRSTSVPKTITLAPLYASTTTDPDGYYGTDGWLMPTSSSLPSYITGFSAGATATLGSGYQPIDDPTLAIGPTVADISSGLAYQIPGYTAETTLYTFNVNSSAPSSFLMGVAFGNLPLDQSAYNSAGFRVSLGSSDSGAVPALGNNGLIDWIFFQVDGAGAGDVINLYGTGGPNGFTDLAAISFDPVVVPEPSSAALFALGGVGLARLVIRRRRA
jgi:hypothetical protein